MFRQENDIVSQKPLGRKAYGSIGHLPNSRLGPGDHKVEDGMARICLEKPRDRFDVIIVQEKLDGSNCAVAKVRGVIMPLTRAGYHANTSPYEQHHKFAAWVNVQYVRFAELLREGERLVGEWLALAHGTRYRLEHEPFVAFDLMIADKRAPFNEFLRRTYKHDFVVPRLIHYGYPLSHKELLKRLEPSGHGAMDPVEGYVCRVERKGKVDFLAKWVRPDKEDGRYFKEKYGEDVWNITVE